MKASFHPTLLILLLLSASLSAFAQNKPIPKPILGGVVNGKATSLPKPAYPEDARLAKFSGVVKVKVLIDETGKVISAEAIEGLENVSLRQSAEAAAMLATFSPTRLSGEPVKVSGVIVYNFVGTTTNEERVQVLGVATLLHTTWHFAHDPDGHYAELEDPSVFKGYAEEFPAFAKELTALTVLKNLSFDQRIEAIERAKTSVRAKLNDQEKWQFELGEELMEIVAPMMVATGNGSSALMGGLDEASIKLHLKNLKQLTLSAPPDFPADVLQKIKDFAALDELDNLLSPQNKAQLVSKFGIIIETIKPGVTK